MVSIVDFGTGGAAAHPLVQAWQAGAPVTVEALIAERVRMEWESDGENAPQYPLIRRADHADIDAAIASALAAFRDRAYRVLIDDRAVASLDERTSVSPQTMVAFVPTAG